MTNDTWTGGWNASGATAASMQVRSALMMALTRHIERAGWTQAQAATTFHVTQPRISDLQRGKIALFSIDALINMTACAGMRIALDIQERAPAPDTAAIKKQPV